MSDELKRTAKCSCGADIEEVLDTPLSAGKFWLRIGTAEVCIDNHWHEPEPPGEKVTNEDKDTVRMVRPMDRDVLGSKESQAIHSADSVRGNSNSNTEPEQVTVPERWRANYLAIKHDDSLQWEDTPFVLKVLEELGAAEERLGAAEHRADNAEEQLDDLCDALSGAGLIQDPESANLDIILDDLLAERDRLQSQLAAAEQRADVAEKDVGTLRETVSGLNKYSDDLEGRLNADKEAGRWQNAIYDEVRKHVPNPDAIDGGGCDSGDPLDFSIAEIGQGLAQLEAERDRLKEQLAEDEKATAEILEMANRYMAQEEGLRAKVAELEALRLALTKDRDYWSYRAIGAEAELATAKDELSYHSDKGDMRHIEGEEK